MNTNIKYDYDLVELEAKARQLRAEALREGAAALKMWVRSFFQARPGAAARQA